MAGEALIHWGQQREPKPFLRKGEVLRFALAAGYERSWKRRSAAEAAGTWDRSHVDAYRAQEWASLILDCTAPILTAELMRIPDYWRAFKSGAQFGLQHWDMGDGRIVWTYICLRVKDGAVIGTDYATEEEESAFVKDVVDRVLDEEGP